LRSVDLNEFKVSIIGSDSLGVRSLATFVNVCEKNIGIDLGASLAPRRFGLPPHEIEIKKLNETLKQIEDHIKISDIIIITHYHYDHYIRDKPYLYYGKRLFIKDPNKNINRSQSFRAKIFLKENKVEENAEINIADGNSYNIDNVVLEFSKAFAGYKVSQKSVEKGLDNLKKVIENKVANKIVVDHHILRDINYKEILKDHYRLAKENGVSLLTAAEFMGYEIQQLEARRKELWGK
jgi:predicted metallo-beta-lactamase superfamily hydrolase